MKKPFFTWACLCLIFSASAQFSDSLKTISDLFDEHSTGLISDRIPYGVLYNRVYPWSALDRWQSGDTTDVPAQKLVKVSRSKKFHHYIGRKELMAIPFHLFAPSLFYKLLRRRYS